MGVSTVFDEKVADHIKTVGEKSTVLGPGRIGRCTQAAVRLAFHGSTSGQVTFRFSHHQDFPGNPEVITAISAPGGAGDSTVTVEIPTKYLGGFVDIVVTQTIDGNGLSAWASGRR